jgi:hypothetical protein
MNAPASPQLIFNWDQPRQRNLVLTGFVAASFVIHVAAFYLFQVVYPQTVSLLPAPRRLNLMTASSEQTATLLHWIDAEDPALASTTRRPAHMQRREMGKVEHVPSYFAREAMLKEPPPLAVDLRVPSAQPPGPVPIARPAVSAPIGSQPTRISFSSELQQLGGAKFVPINFKTSTNEAPQNAQFRIAVDAKGAVVYCFTLASAGDAGLDELARQYLALSRFPARAVPLAAPELTAKAGSRIEGLPSNDDSLVWGVATIEWGNDVAAATPKPTPVAP